MFRDGCLNRWLYAGIREVQELTDAWLYEYNHERPDGSLGGLSPAQFEQLHWQNSKSVIKKGVSGLNLGMVSRSWSGHSVHENQKLMFRLASM